MDPIRNRNILVYGALSGSSIAWVVKITRQDVVVTLVIILLFLMHNTSRHYKISKSVRKYMNIISENYTEWKRIAFYCMVTCEMKLFSTKFFWYIDSA